MNFIWWGEEVLAIHKIITLNWCINMFNIWLLGSLSFKKDNKILQGKVLRNLCYFFPFSKLDLLKIYRNVYRNLLCLFTSEIFIKFNMPHVTHSEKYISFLSKLNGLWSWWQFSFQFQTKWNYIRFKIGRKPVTTIIYSIQFEKKWNLFLWVQDKLNIFWDLHNAYIPSMFEVSLNLRPQAGKTYVGCPRDWPITPYWEPNWTPPLNPSIQ